MTGNHVMKPTQQDAALFVKPWANRDLMRTNGSVATSIRAVKARGPPTKRWTGKGSTEPFRKEGGQTAAQQDPATSYQEYANFHPRS